MSEIKQKVIQVDNYFVNNYLNHLNRRLEINKKPQLIDCLIMCLYLFNIFKYILLLFEKFDYETRILFYDMTLILGGLERYLKIILISTYIMGFCLHGMLYFNSSKKSMNWSQLFEMIRGNVFPSKLGLEISDKPIVDKLRIRASLIYKIINIVLIVYRKKILY